MGYVSLERKQVHIYITQIRAHASGLLGVLLVGALANQAHGTITTFVSEDLSSPFPITTFTSAEVTGADMDGRLSITATFADVTGNLFSETATWSADGGLAGIADPGTFWTIRQSGDTFDLDNTWRLDVNPMNPDDPAAITPIIQSLEFEFDNSSFANAALFDRTFFDTKGTPGTEFGRDFDIVDNSTSLDDLTAQAIYSLPADLQGDSLPPVGDSFARLFVNFDGFSLASSDSYFVEWVQDTDLGVPSPGAVGLLAIAGVGAARRRRV